MHIKQLSVFVENKSGRLAQLTGFLAENGINIHAMSIADTTDFGILRLITSDQLKAEKVLKENGVTVKMTDVLAVGLEHKPGSLSSVLKKLEERNVSIEYMYAFTSRNEKYDAMVILKTAVGSKALEEISGLNIIGENDINAIKNT